REFSRAYNGINQSHTDLGTILRVTIIILVFIMLIEHIPLISALHKRFPKVLHDIFGSEIMGAAASVFKAAAHVLLAVGVVLFILVYAGLGTIAFPKMVAQQMGGGQAAVDASQYVVVHFGPGLFLMLSGLLVTSATMLRPIAIVAAVIAGGTVLLACFHPAWLAPFFHVVGSYYTSTK